MSREIISSAYSMRMSPRTLTAMDNCLLLILVLKTVSETTEGQDASLIVFEPTKICRSMPTTQDRNNLCSYYTVASAFQTKIRFQARTR